MSYLIWIVTIDWYIEMLLQRIEKKQVDIGIGQTKTQSLISAERKDLNEQHSQWQKDIKVQTLKLSNTLLNAGEFEKSFIMK
jgi:hypothetical protein